MYKRIIAILIIVILFGTLIGCSKNKGEEPMENKVCMELEDERKIYITLYPDVAPISVANFIKLVKANYYDGVIFHRVIDNFMIQTGGYYMSEDGTTIMNKPRMDTIKGEFSANGVENNLKHTVGVVSMARANAYDSASTQFFICSADYPSLDGNYAAFGKVEDEESLKVVMAISSANTVYVDGSLANFPYPVITIKTMRMVGNA